MVSLVLKSVFLRFILPIVLLIACLLRPSVISFLYGVLVLISQLVPTITSNSVSGSTRAYLLGSLVVSVASCLAQLSFQIYAAITNGRESIDRCSETFEILRQFGLEPVTGGVDTLNLARLVLPEILALVGSSAAFLVCIRLQTATSDSLPSAQFGAVNEAAEHQSLGVKRANEDGREKPDPSGHLLSAVDKISLFASRLADVLTALLLALAAEIFPSLPSAVYFLSFLALLTFWASHRPIHTTTLDRFRAFLMAICSLHLFMLYLYQVPGLFHRLPPDELTARLLGLTQFVSGNCTSYSVLTPNLSLIWPAYISPLLVLLLYCYSALLLRYSESIAKRRSHTTEASRPFTDIVLSDDNSSIHEELLGNGSEADSHQNSADMTPKRRSQRPPPPVRGFSIGTVPMDRTEFLALFKFCGTIASSSYVLTCLAMVAWAILYHTWFSFVLLLWALVIWMLPHSQQTCFYSSPLLVFYAQALLVIQFICGMNLTADEFPGPGDIDEKKQFGIVNQFLRPGCVPLLLKTFLSLPYFLSLRLFMRQRGSDSSSHRMSVFDPNGRSGSDSDWFRDLLNRLWIYVCYAVILFVSLRNPVTAYNIIYMFFLSGSIILLQVSYKLWRLSLFAYWTVVAVYSILVLLLLYTFQFVGVPKFFIDHFRWTTAFMASLGLDVFPDAELLWKLMTPIGYLLVVILQLKYFHRSFLRVTSPTAIGGDGDRAVEESSDGSVSKWSAWRSFFLRLVEACWTLAEIHLPKVVAFMFVATAVFDVAAVNMVLMVLGVLVLTLRKCHRCFVVLATCWSAAVVIARMIIQMVPIGNEVANYTCPSSSVAENYSEANETLVNKTISEWAGFTATSVIAHYLRWYIGIFAVVALEMVVILRNKYHRQRNGLTAAAQPVLFPGVTRDRADESLSACAKFLANHIFYKFGLELSYTMTAIVVTVRMDGVAAFYMFLLLGLVFLRRSHVARVWGLYVALLTILMPLQYASRLGLPPSLCISMPWEPPTELAVWLYLPSYVNELQPNVIFLVADFFQLLFVSCQLYVFRVETSVGPAAEGGENSEVPRHQDDNDFSPNSAIPVADFTGNNRSTYIDWLKDAIFQYFHWLTLIILFSAAVAGINVFALGYLLSCFLLLWKGNDIFCSPLHRVIRKWSFLLAYTLVVMLIKVFIQLLGCVYSRILIDLCWVKQLCSIVCIRTSQVQSVTCSIAASEAKTSLDVMVMVFILIQLRIFGSHYFQHVIKEFYAQKRLASYGASVINLLTSHEISDEKEKEQKVLNSLEEKMKLIDRRQAEKAAQSGVKTESPKYYLDGRYSGDYYMFSAEDQPDAAKIPDVDELLIDEGKEDDKAAVVEADAAVPVDSAVSTDERKDISAIRKIFTWCSDATVTLVNMVTFQFNKWAINHRRVALLLAEKKKKLKEEMEIDSGHMSDHQTVTGTTNSLLTVDVDDLTSLDSNLAELDRHHNVFGRFLMSSWYLLVSRTELLCYIAIILNMLGSGSVLSLPLPLMAFFWGSLCLPRPSKTFWLSCITYTEAIVVVKFVFQFSFVDFWQQGSAAAAEKPFFVPRILGLLKEDYFAAWDIVLLMALFYHRYTLKTLGLWKDIQKEGDTPTQVEIVTQQQDVGPTVELEGSVARRDNGDVAMVGSLGYFSSFRKFFTLLVESEPPKRRWYRVDVYALMFLCDFFCLLICIVGFNQFGTSQAPNANVVSLLQENRVPLPFVLLLLVQFVLIIIDRALYLRHWQTGKVVFHFLLIAAVHAYVFFGLPAITEVPLVRNLPGKLWYFIKCLYFLLSARQIRAGYPVRILGNFLTKSFGMFNKLLFQVFMAIPFLFELRTVMDWIWTDTNLTLFDYFKVEDIYANVYKTKCARRFEAKNPQPIAEQRGWIAKYSAGFLIFLLIVVVLWLPLLLFSLLNAIGERSLTERCQVKLEIEGYPPLYAATAQNADLQSLESVYNQYKNAAVSSKTAQAIFNDYSAQDVQTASFPSFSESVWTISRPSREVLIAELNSTSKLFMTFTWKFTRPAKGSANEIITGGRNRISLTDVNLRRNLSRMLNLSDPDAPDSVTVERLYPVFVQVRPTGEVSAMTALEYGLLQEKQMRVDDLTITYANISLGFSRDLSNDSEPSVPRRYWKVDMFVPFWNQSGPVGQKQKLMLAAFVDKVFPSLLSSLTSNGIIYLYVAVVLAIGRLIRSVLTGAVSSIFVEELPNVDKILQLCLDIYLVREVRNFQLEVLLYAKLLFLYRSPQTMISWTKLKKD